MKYLVNVTLLAICFILVGFSSANQPIDKVNTIFIDIGHGGKDPGALGVNNSLEKEIAFRIATQIGALLKTYLPEVKYFYTRQSDEFISLADRARMANKQNADLFISIHANSSPSPEIYGTETFVMGISSIPENLRVAMTENQAIQYEDEKKRKKEYRDFDLHADYINHILVANRQNAVRQRSITMAHLVEKNFASSIGKRHSRGVKQANLIVLWKTTMPSVLIETGYLSNSKEEKYLSSEEGILETASSIYRAIRDYIATIEK
ncbi:MAG: N-acetylmuramoyl-L-alanine amidase [Cytophagales bacterium]|nr:N-acetylmuramoyl-L-alanine amidase [Bernardetiaceae bacterium]MDW8210942.1 N-acetylmuramoyl-L-alanine amidase [Cytophagales bacterium]